MEGPGEVGRNGLRARWRRQHRHMHEHPEVREIQMLVQILLIPRAQMRIRQGSHGTICAATEDPRADRDRSPEVEGVREAAEERSVVLENRLTVLQDTLAVLEQEARRMLLLLLPITV